MGFAYLVYDIKHPHLVYPAGTTPSGPLGVDNLLPVALEPRQEAAVDHEQAAEVGAGDEVVEPIRRGDGCGVVLLYQLRPLGPVRVVRHPIVGP